MTELEPPKWVVCENCGQLTPEYLQTCFKCGKPRVKPASTEIPPAPILAPPAPEPEKEPYGWWDCPKCGNRDNPPKLMWCMKCHAVRPDYHPKAETPKPAPAPKPSAPTTQPAPLPTGTPVTTAPKSWLKPALAWLTVIATGLSIASFFVPALAPIAVLIKSIVAALSNLPF